MRVWKLTAALCLSVVACGDDDKGGDSTANLDSKKASELTGKELLQFCEWLIDETEGNVTDEQFCTQDAAEYASSSTECEELRDECIDELAEAEEGDCSDFSISKACTVEIAKLKTCFRDLSKLYGDAARGASCDEYEDAIVSDFPKSCTSLPEACVEIESSSAKVSGLRVR